MKKRIVVLGGGTGGTLLANRLRRQMSRGAAEIVVVDADDKHVYQPGLLFVPFGLASAEALVRSRQHQLRAGVEFHCSAIDHVDLQNDTVLLADGTSLCYDVLVVATGARLMPGETDGLLGPGWLEKVFTFYSLDAATALRRALAGFDGGRLVVAVMDMPIKCPVAPLEFCFLADWFFRKRGVRDRVELAFVTPLPGGGAPYNASTVFEFGEAWQGFSWNFAWPPSLSVIESIGGVPGAVQ